MTAAIFAPPAPGPAKAPGGRAGANVTVHDRARGAFQELLSQKIGQRLELMEQKKAEGDARRQQGRIGSFAAGRPGHAADLERGGRCADAPGTRRAPAADGRPPQTERPDGTGRRIPGGFAAGAEGGSAVGGENLMGKNALVHPWGHGPVTAKAPEGTAPAPGKGPVPAFGRTPFPGEAGPRFAPARPGDGGEGASSSETPDVTPLWKEFMKRWTEGAGNPEREEEDAADGALGAEPLRRAFRAGRPK